MKPVILLYAVLIVRSSCARILETDSTCNNISEYANCPNDLFVLEKALYGIEGNKLNLINTFYPSRAISTAFVKVTYKFKNESGGISNDCNVIYWWASGGFLLVQSPSIFRFSSLFIGNEVDKLNALELTLPYECRRLVPPDDKTGKCSCKKDDDTLLDILTQQLKLYAKYNDPGSVTRDDSSAVIALCDEEIENRYYSVDLRNVLNSGISIFFFFLCVVVLPFISVSFNTTMIRSWNTAIQNKLTHSANHPDLAGIVIISFFLTLYVTCLDVVSAVFAYSKKDEIGGQNHNITGSFNIRVTIILSIYDLSVLITQVIAFCYMTFNPAGKDNDCCFSCFKWYFTLYFNLIFGGSDKKPVWESSGIHTDEKYKNKGLDHDDIKKKLLIASNVRYLWVLTFCILAPTFSLSSHFMFILLSWLTDSTQATSLAIVYIGTLSFLHVVIRQCYVINSHKNSNACCESTECPDCCLLLYPYKQCCVTLCTVVCHCLCPCKIVSQVPNDSDSGKKSSTNKTVPDDKTKLLESGAAENNRVDESGSCTIVSQVTNDSDSGKKSSTSKTVPDDKTKLLERGAAENNRVDESGSCTTVSQVTNDSDSGKKSSTSKTVPDDKTKLLESGAAENNRVDESGSCTIVSQVTNDSDSGKKSSTSKTVPNDKTKLLESGAAENNRVDEIGSCSCISVVCVIMVCVLVVLIIGSVVGIIILSIEDSKFWPIFVVAVIFFMLALIPSVVVLYAENRNNKSFCCIKICTATEAFQEDNQKKCYCCTLVRMKSTSQVKPSKSNFLCCGRKLSKQNKAKFDEQVNLEMGDMDPIQKMITSPNKDSITDTSVKKANEKYTYEGDIFFDNKAFCVSFGWGLLMLAIIILILLAFWELPISAVNLPNYLLNIFQILLVVISVMIAYKLFFTDEPGMNGFINYLRFSYRKSHKYDISDVERGSTSNIPNPYMPSDKHKMMYDKYSDMEAVGQLVGKIMHHLESHLTNKSMDSSVSTRGSTSLEQFLKQRGRKRTAKKVVPSDGNCLFSALSYQLTGTSEHQSQMRKEIVALESNEKKVFGDLYGTENDITFDEHLKKINQDRTWGTDLEITAAATIFKLPIYVATDKTGTAVWCRYLPSNRIKDVPQTSIQVLKDLKNPWIEIGCVNSNHFDAIEPIRLPRP